MRKEQYVQANNKGDKTRQHRLIAERALGRPLPKGVEIHHIDRNGRNNHPDNLVICPDKAYHMLLHVRQEALDATGHADWRRCHICGKHSDPLEMDLYPKATQKRAFHRECNNKAARESKQKRKEQQCAS